MKVRKVLLVVAATLLVMASFAPLASVRAAGPGLIPIPTAPPIRLAKPDLIFLSAGCTRASNGGRLIFFTVMNDTLIGFGAASGNFTIAVAGHLIQQNSLAPQQRQSYTVNVANPGWYVIQLDPDNRVGEANEANNIRHVQCY